MSNRVRRLLLPVATLVAISPVAVYAQGTSPAPAPAIPQTTPTTTKPNTDVIAFPVRANDTLRITVADAEDLSGEFRVDNNDGTITIARLGSIPVLGLTQQAVINKVSQRIREKKLLKVPSVAAYLTNRKAKEVSVNGAVQTQGVREVKDGATLSEVLETATPGTTADLTRVVITRGDKDITVNYKKYQVGEERGETVNPLMEDGDKIYVYSSVQGAGVVRIVGEVKDSTKIQAPITVGATAGQIIQEAGGITDYADRGNIVVVRGDKRIPVQYQNILQGMPGSDVTLQDGDIVVIPRQERPKQFTIAGAVRDPKTILIVPGDPLTITDALAKAGGTTDGARLFKVELNRRNPDGTMTKKEIDLRKSKDAVLPINDGDYVFVPFPNRKNNIDPFNAVGLLSGLSMIFGQLRR